ncbi:MAG: insulinase family protein [Saprospiraceae bacterium]|nr:insulinase family protein [Saprospiraceae bacterium]
MKGLCLLLCLISGTQAFCQIDSLLLAYDHYTLQNGLQVILQPEQNAKEVSVEFWLLDGTSIDQPHEYGLQHFFEHVMPYSPMDSVKKREFFDYYLKGGNAQVKKDFSRFYLKVLPKGLELALERASGRLIAGANSISERRIEDERKRVLAEIERNAKNPHWSAAGSLAIYEGTFGKGHPYAANGYGNMENNKHFSLDDLRKRYDEVVYANNVVLFVVGNFDKDDAKKMIPKYFNGIESRTKPVDTPISIKQSSNRVSTMAPHPNDSLNTMVFSWAISAWNIEDDAALKLISAHLNNSLQKEKLPSSVRKSSINTDMYINAGQFYVRIQFSNPKDSTQIEQLILEEINQLAKKNIGESDLQNARESEIKNIKDMQKQLGFGWSRTELLGKSLLYTGNPNAYFERLKLQQRMTTRRLKKTARKWLKDKPFTITFVARG